MYMELRSTRRHLTAANPHNFTAMSEKLYAESAEFRITSSGMRIVSEDERFGNVEYGVVVLTFYRVLGSF